MPSSRAALALLLVNFRTRWMCSFSMASKESESVSSVSKSIGSRPGVSSFVSDKITQRSITFFSSRIFPLHGCLLNAARNWSLIFTDPLLVFIPNSFAKCSAKRSMSSFRSRKGGSWKTKTEKRKKEMMAIRFLSDFKFYSLHQQKVCILLL